MPEISIILPAYNGASTLAAALNSIFLQSFANFELVAVNDGSTDSTSEILEQFRQKDSRVRIISHEKNLGLTLSLNEALSQIRGNYVARLDSDDIWTDKNKLTKQYEFLKKNSHCVLVGSWAEFTDAREKHVKYFKPPVTDSAIRKQLLLHNCFIHSSILASAQAMQQAGGYLPEDQYAEDYGLWLRMGAMGQMTNLPEIMVQYGISQEGITRTKNLEQINSVLNFIKKFKGKYPYFYLALLKWNLQKIIKLG